MQPICCEPILGLFVQTTQDRRCSNEFEHLIDVKFSCVRLIVLLSTSALSANLLARL